MSVDLELTPKTKRPAGERCCEPVVYPEVERQQAEAHRPQIAKALGDPFGCSSSTCCASTPARSASASWCRCSTSASPRCPHHLKKLRDAGIVDSERQGLWAYYYVIPDALEELSAWLTWGTTSARPSASRYANAAKTAAESGNPSCSRELPAAAPSR